MIIDMSKYKTVYKEVEVSLEDFDDEDLLDELESRGGLPTATIGPYDYKKLVEQIWMRRRNGQDYNYPLDQLIYNVTGHIV